MAKYTGKNATLSFGGTEYTCLTDIAMNGAVSMATAECSAATGNAVTHKAVGAENWTVTTTILLEAASITQEAAFAPGVSGAVIVYPNGNVIGNKSFTWTSGFVSSDVEPVAVAAQATMAITLECDGARVAALVTV